MWPDDETPEPAAWINFNAATGARNVSFVCESELASIPLWREPPRKQFGEAWMTRDEIIRMAREAGFALPDGPFITWGASNEQLERFAALVAAHEREACAKVCDQMFHDWCNQEFEDEDEAYKNKPDAEDCKKAIRARGQL